MAVTGNRSVTVQFTGDVTYTQQFAAVANTTSPGQIQLVNLASGANTITPPTTTSVACVLIPPAANTNSITLKGVTGDTGIRIHNVDPTVITLNSGSSTFCLTAGTTTTGVRLIWI